MCGNGIRENPGGHQSSFRTLPVTVRRNAYGRQLGSFYTEEEVRGIGIIPMAFIWAPYIESVEEGVEVIAEVGRNIVGVRYENQMGVSFHPEVTDNTSVHRYFLEICEQWTNKKKEGL